MISKNRNVIARKVFYHFLSTSLFPAVVKIQLRVIKLYVDAHKCHHAVCNYRRLIHFDAQLIMGKLSSQVKHSLHCNSPLCTGLLHTVHMAPVMKFPLRAR